MESRAPIQYPTDKASLLHHPIFTSSRRSPWKYVVVPARKFDGYTQRTCCLKGRWLLERIQIPVLCFIHRLGDRKITPNAKLDPTGSRNSIALSLALSTRVDKVRRSVTELLSNVPALCWPTKIGRYSYHRESVHLPRLDYRPMDQDYAGLVDYD